MALECGGISRWLRRVGASPGGFGEYVHHQEWGHHQVALRVGASPGGFGE